MKEKEEIELRKQGAILGALVADSAALGLHWLYDPARILEVGGESPEFLGPDPEHYENVLAFFAHEDKGVGDQTHYGEQLLVALRSLAEMEGWFPAHYLQHFCETFGYGGSWSGYIDGATKGTLINAVVEEDALLAKAKALAPDIDAYVYKVLLNLIQTADATIDRNQRVDSILASINTKFEDPKLQRDAEKVLRYYEENKHFKCGADDDQVPAFSKIPPIVARYAGEAELMEKIEEAIRITNNNEEAVVFSLFGARVLEDVILGKSIPDALEEACLASSPEVEKRIREALSSEYDKGESLGSAFGMSCVVKDAFPLSVGILKHAPDFRWGIRQNILAGGDNAGRAIFVGSVLGAAYGLAPNRGIPLAWLAKLQSLNIYFELMGAALGSEKAS